MAKKRNTKVVGKASDAPERESTLAGKTELAFDDFDANVPEDAVAAVLGGDGVDETPVSPAVQDALSGIVNDESDGPVTQNQLAQAIAALAKSMQVMVDQAPIKRVPFAKFKTRSPFNPTGNKKRKLTRRCYQNGSPMNIKLLHDEEISLLNQLKAGRFINGLVTVVIMQNGGNTDLHIVYKNKTMNQRLANKEHWRNLTELLRRCVDEATARKPRRLIVDDEDQDQDSV